MIILIPLALTSAFDTADNKIILSRLEYFVGIQGTVLSWFKSYLTNRSFSVRFGNFSSLPAKLSCGVPQGSILAPIHFLCIYLLWALFLVSMVYNFTAMQMILKCFYL